MIFKLIILLLPYVKGDDINTCNSVIDYLELPICKSNNIKPIGIKNARKFAELLFDSSKIYMTKEQSECILNYDDFMSNNINQCINDITINNNTIPSKVSRGLAKNNDNEWVSACAPDMPCIEFNKLVRNGSFYELMEDCNAHNLITYLKHNFEFIKSSLYGVEYCQKLYPEKCMFVETCGNVDYIYACPVSKYLIASNFMLLYILDPNIASKMPSCRIIF